MPTYNVLRKSTGEMTQMQMKIAEMEEMLKADPDLDVVPGAVPYGDPWRLGRVKPDGRFGDLIKDIRRRNPGSSLDNSHGF